MAGYISDLKRLTRVIRPASPFFGPGNSNMADHQINGYQAFIDRAISDARVNRAEARAARRRAIKDSALAQRRLEEAEGIRQEASLLLKMARSEQRQTRDTFCQPEAPAQQVIIDAGNAPWHSRNPAPLPVHQWPLSLLQRVLDWASSLLEHLWSGSYNQHRELRDHLSAKVVGTSLTGNSKGLQLSLPDQGLVTVRRPRTPMP